MYAPAKKHLPLGAIGGCGSEPLRVGTMAHLCEAEAPEGPPVHQVVEELFGNESEAPKVERGMFKNFRGKETNTSWCLSVPDPCRVPMRNS